MTSAAVKRLPPEHPKHSVLVVDDEAEVRKTLRVVLEREGLDVVEAEDGRQALALSDERVPCFALIDLVMPGIDGLTLCRQFKQDPRFASVALILVTGKAQDSDLQCGLEVGVVDFVKKPFDMDEMRFRMRTQIRLHETSREQQRDHETLAALISDAKRREEALRVSEQRFRAGFQGASVGQVLTDIEGRLLEVNGAFARMLGYEPNELRGKNVAEITYPEDVAMSQTARKELVENQAEIRRFEKRHLRKDGTPIWVDVSIAALCDSLGRVTQFVTHAIDVSERRQMEERLREKEAERRQIELELRHSQKLQAVGQLAAGIAHEINTPTQYVSDGIYFMKEVFDGLWKLLPKYREAMGALADRPVPADLAADIASLENVVDLDYVLANVPGSIERCLDGVARITTIVRAMKEFAHPGQSEKRPADLTQAIKNTLIIARNEYKYVADVETAFGEIPLVVCHLNDMNQVFLNLIVNAAHAISDVVGNSGKKGKIRISTRCDGKSVHVEIADTGGGIPAAIRERVFEPFFTTKPVGKGSGQGLAIARSVVVDKHGGSLTFASTVGEGTTFAIRLPVDDNSNPEHAAT